MYKAVFIDLDGTLLDDNKNISEENKKAIEYVRSKGGVVCICSGRQFDKVKELKELAGADKYIIYSNGTSIYDCEKKEVIYSVTILDRIKMVLGKIRLIPNLYIRIDTKYGRYINDEKYKSYTDVIYTEEDINNLFENNEIIQLTIGASSVDMINNISNSIEENEENIVKIENRYKANINGNSLNLINIINKNASKGNAICGLCKYLKIDLKDVIAIGDEGNDLSMIRVAGLGIAMENSEEKIKMEADEITKSNIQNGVAEVLYKYF